MKLKQIEFCHNCNKDVEFEFDDTTDRQIIICPNCGHEHWRELDEGQITNIRLNGRQQRFIYKAKLPSFKTIMNQDINTPLDTTIIEVEKLEVLGQDEKGNAIIKGNGQKVVSNRRWGRDRRQG